MSDLIQLLSTLNKRGSEFSKLTVDQQQTEFRKFLETECGYQLVVFTQDGRWVGILRLIAHWTMHVGKVGDFAGHDLRFCYQTSDLAIEALAEWVGREFEGEPTGWHRDPYTGRRRTDGDPNQEYFAP